MSWSLATYTFGGAKAPQYSCLSLGTRSAVSRRQFFLIAAMNALQSPAAGRSKLNKFTRLLKAGKADWKSIL